MCEIHIQFKLASTSAMGKKQMMCFMCVKFVVLFFFVLQDL